jgi:putative Mg2+ transporter-C (MgtC) family protein
MDDALWSQLGTLAISGALAGLLGLERELARKPAGLRTHILVGLGSALFMLLGEDVLQRHAADGGGVHGDPIRVIQAIAVGISFLGAGTIIHDGGARVEGLTTAASILIAAGIGIAVAVGRVPLAVAVSVAVVLILFVLGRLEERMGTNERPRSTDPTGRGPGPGDRVESPASE